MNLDIDSCFKESFKQIQEVTANRNICVKISSINNGTKKSKKNQNSILENLCTPIYKNFILSCTWIKYVAA